MGDQDIDPIAREDKPRDPGSGSDRDRDRAHARVQRSSEKAATAGGDDLGFGDRVAGREGVTRNPAGESLGGPGPSQNIGGSYPTLRPDLPGEIAGLQDLSAREPDAGDEDRFLRRRRPGER